MNADSIIKLILDNLPAIIMVLGAIGLLAFLAKQIRKSVADLRALAKRTSNKVDDFLVDLVDDPLLEIADLVERGDVKGAQRKIDELRLKVQAKKAS